MIPRLLKGVGVPKDMCNDYVKSSAEISGLKHAYVVGVADPTNALPPGQVFVSGFSYVETPNDEIFITRSPALKASDGRKVKLVTSRPEKMSGEDWTWLQALPFGAIVFANPKEGTQPLPVQIGNGDLDGDLYFILWDSELLSHIKTDPIVELQLEEEDVDAENAMPSSHSHWLEEAQQLMVKSIKEEMHLGALIGALWGLSQKTQDDSSEYMNDADAIELANAFTQALDYKKHGRKIELSPHLRGHPKLAEHQGYFV